MNIAYDQGLYVFNNTLRAELKDQLNYALNPVQFAHNRLACLNKSVGLFTELRLFTIMN